MAEKDYAVPAGFSLPDFIEELKKTSGARGHTVAVSGSGNSYALSAKTGEVTLSLSGGTLSVHRKIPPFNIGSVLTVIGVVTAIAVAMVGGGFSLLFLILPAIGWIVESVLLIPTDAILKDIRRLLPQYVSRPSETPTQQTHTRQATAPASSGSARRFCPGCGGEVIPGSKFCNKCGEKLL